MFGDITAGFFCYRKRCLSLFNSDIIDSVAFDDENSSIEGKEKIDINMYKLGHNILRLFDVLWKFPFNTSETNHHY